MKQTQQQAIQQRLSLSQHMYTSLSLLQMGSADFLLALKQERFRNPFLKCSAPAPPLPAGKAKNLPQDNREIVVEHSNTDDLIAQISLIRMPQGERELACNLVHCLDERGFFTESPEEISTYLQAEPEGIIAVVEKLQKAVDPAGVFAWSLQDCFRLQLEAKNRFDPMIEALLNHLDLIAAQDIVSICKILRVDREDAEDMMDDIRSLSAAPLSYGQEQSDICQMPDLFFHPSPDGTFDVTLNEAALPNVLTDDALFSAIKATETDQASLNYYRDCYKTAGSFVFAMQKRANTLLLIGQEIADVQYRYLKTGRPLDRKPLTMGGMATKLGINKSTISRALRNSLLETPQGLMPASSFFVRPLTENSDQKTREQALKRLSLIIKTEDRKHPYSDEVLAELMSKVNLAISRRTVAKYRQFLKIPNAFKRRRNII